MKKKTAATTASQLGKARSVKKESPTPETRMTPIAMCLISVGLNLITDLVTGEDDVVYARMSGGAIGLNKDCL